MIIRGTPKNTGDYISANSELAIKLHSNGFIPKYIDGKYTYFKKDKDIIEFIGKIDK